MSNKITTTISIVSHGQSHHVDRLIDSLADQELVSNLQLVVTENLPKARGFEDANSGFPEYIAWHNSEPLGFAANHNQAFQSAKGDFFCVVNPDALFVEPVLGHLIEHIWNGAADIVAPSVVDSAGRLQDNFRDVPSPIDLARRALTRNISPVLSEVPQNPIFPQWIAATFLLMRSETFSALGGFDDEYVLYFEDVDLGCRARLARMKLMVDPAHKIVHEPRRASHRKVRFFLMHARSAIRFYRSEVYGDYLKFKT